MITEHLDSVQEKDKILILGNFNSTTFQYGNGEKNLLTLGTRNRNLQDFIDSNFPEFSRKYEWGHLGRGPYKYRGIGN